MLHPLFTMLVQRPDLVFNHLLAYGALVRQETAGAGTAVLNKFVCWAVAALLLCLTLGLAGVAVMLGILQGQFHWVLVAVPGAPLLLGCIAVAFAVRPLQVAQFSQIKLQLDNDFFALRSAVAVRD